MRKVIKGKAKRPHNPFKDRKKKEHLIEYLCIDCQDPCVEVDPNNIRVIEQRCRRCVKHQPRETVFENPIRCNKCGIILCLPQEFARGTCDYCEFKRAYLQGELKEEFFI